MNILIIEDELAIRQHLAAIIHDHYDTWTADVCGTYEQAIALAAKNTYNLFIIDYELDKSNPDKNGLSLGLQLSAMDKYKNAPIIFETSYSEHIFDVVNQLNCVYYLTKPYGTEQVISMLNKITKYIPLKKKLFLKDAHGISAYIYLEDIIYVVADRHNLNIVMPATTFMCRRQSLDSLADMCDGALIRCHKSHLVNKHYVTDIDTRSYYVTVKHPVIGQTYTINLGRAYIKAIQNAVIENSSIS